MPLVAVVVCTHNRPSDTLACLKALWPQLHGTDTAIMVVDSASDPLERAQLEAGLAAYGGIGHLRLEQTGLSAARNAGVAATRSEWIAFIDDDAIPNPDWHAKLQEVLAGLGKDCGAVGGRILPLFPPGLKPRLGARWKQYLSLNETLGDVDCTERPIVICANLAFRRVALRQAGGFPVKLGRFGKTLLSGEDVLALYRLRGKGWRIRYQSEFGVRHSISRTRLTRSWVRSRAYWDGISTVRLARLEEDRRWLLLGLKVLVALPAVGVFALMRLPGEWDFRLYFNWGVLTEVVHPTRHPEVASVDGRKPANPAGRATLQMAQQNQYLMDFSLGLINRTGAYHVCNDLLRELPGYFPEVRYWRILRRKVEDGVLRKIAGRLMLHEIGLLRDRPILRWPEGHALPGRRRLFLDPLYVLRTKLERDDIVLCHDIGPVSHPELFGQHRFEIYSAAYEKIRQAGPGMVFVSDASQAAFRARFGENFRFFQTVAQYIRPGIMTGATEPVPGVTRPFLLTVGALEPRKNYPRVMEAYRRSGLHERGVSYVFCGACGDSARETLELATRTPGVTALGYVSEAQLRWLYQNSCGFVLPSLLEGFGLPLIEAAQRGLAAMASGGGAQEEAIGGAAILVDPTSTESVMEGMLRLVDLGDAERRAMVDRAARRGKVLPYQRYIDGWDKVLARNDRFEATDGWAASDPEEKAALQPEVT